MLKIPAKSDAGQPKKEDQNVVERVIVTYITNGTVT
jgi:hypothetical protein